MGSINLGSNGTITNLAVGGLPDGTVDKDTLADNFDDDIRSNIALLGFKTAVNGSLAKYSLVDQIVDEYTDASGVDASATSGTTRSSGAYIGANTVTPTTSGGTKTTDGEYSVHSITSTGSTNFVTDGTLNDLSYLIIGGGGGGGQDIAGGGGAGGMVEGTLSSLAAGTYAAVVGDGGTRALNGSAPQAGDDSTWNSRTAKGGGPGQGCTHFNTVDNDGGSGGGGGHTGKGDKIQQNQNSGVANLTQYGNNGADGNCNDWGGGGGGAGGDASTYYGGDGRQSSITGSAVWYAGGGSGATAANNVTNATNAINGGGGSNAGTRAGTDGKGGGGAAGHGSWGAGGNGGSGIVIIRYKTDTVGDEGSANIVLQSTDTTAESVPTKADLITLIENSSGGGAATLNTDIKAYVSRDSGANWTQGTLVDEGTWGTDKKILAVHDIDISSQPSGTAMCYKITTHNQATNGKRTRIHATSLGWK